MVNEETSKYRTDDEKLGEVALKISKVIEENSKVDWHDNVDVHNKIAQEIDDILYDYTRDTGIEIPFEEIDKIIERIKSVALKRY